MACTLRRFAKTPGGLRRRRASTYLFVRLRKMPQEAQHVYQILVRVLHRQEQVRIP